MKNIPSNSWNLPRPMNYLDRTVVGFDLRKKSSLSNLTMTSYDENVRFEEINEKYEFQHDVQNSMNLFFIDPSKIESLILPADSLIIAFDLPTEFVQTLLNGNISRPSPLPNFQLDGEWFFAGFDIIDPINQMSIFHDFDGIEEKLNFAKQEFNLKLNEYGLVTDLENSIKGSEYFDTLIYEHAPFIPSGVWLKT
jgi:hypothetical protein